MTGYVCLGGGNSGSIIFKDTGKTKSIEENWWTNSREADDAKRDGHDRKDSLLYLQVLPYDMCSQKVGGINE